MAFTLEVTFSGLCLYILDPKRDAKGNLVRDSQNKVFLNKAGILMPDGRRRPGADPPRHRDKRLAEPHVGYIRFNLANINPSIPPGVKRRHRDRPEYELLHRFDRQTLEFVGDFENEEMKDEVEVPDLGAFAKNLKPVPKLFDLDPPTELLMRTILTGGQLVAKARETEKWTIPRRMDRKLNAPYTAKFASFVTWKRTVKSSAVTVRVTDFGKTSPQAEFELRPAPREKAVSVSVGNLCAHNPLEWAEMNLRRVTGADLDFKWLYRLLEPTDCPYDELLQEDELPVPEPAPSAGVTGSEDCMPTKILISF